MKAKEVADRVRKFFRSIMDGVKHVGQQSSRLGGFLREICSPSSLFTLIPDLWVLVAATAAVHQGQPSAAPSTTPVCSEHCLKLPGKNLAFLLASSPSPVSHPSQGPAERVVLAPAHRGRVQRGAGKPLY